jgi:hypothetical protein
MDAVFPGALVEDYESSTNEFDLPDPNDRHVAAAADRAGANVIVTDNVDDFPSNKLRRRGMFAQCADDLIADQIYLTGVVLALLSLHSSGTKKV